MAASNQVLWRSSLSLNLRDNECLEQEQLDLFHNLEKLIASAVSICRLDGSLQCQIGGLITVIEELQRLLRLSFSEIKRLERTLDHQKNNFASNILSLQRQIKQLPRAVDSSTCKSDVTLATDEINPDDGKLHNVSLVDESYGIEEESDNSIQNVLADLPEVAEDHDVVDSALVVQPNGVYHGISDEKQETSTERSTSDSRETMDTLPSSAQTIENTTEEMTSNVNEEHSPTIRNLEDPKVIPTAETLNDSLPDTEDQIPEILVRSPRLSAKSNEKGLVNKGISISPAKKKPVRARLTVRKHSENPKKSSQVNHIAGKNSRQRNYRNPAKVEMTQNNKKLRAIKVKLSNIKVSHKSTTSKKIFGQEKSAGKTNVLARNSSFSNGTKIGKGGKSASSKKPIDKYVNLDFLLMANQVMSELVTDVEREEAALDQVNESERKDVVNLAKLYRLRVRMAGKCEGVLPVVLVKGRESCLPKPGEVDALLSTMTDSIAGKNRPGKRPGNKHRNQVGTSVSSKSKKRRL